MALTIDYTGKSVVVIGGTSAISASRNMRSPNERSPSRSITQPSDTCFAGASSSSACITTDVGIRASITPGLRLLHWTDTRPQG